MNLSDVWWYRLEGSLDKILGITGRDFAVTDTPFVPWSDEDFGETDDPADGPAEPYREGSCPRGDSLDFVQHFSGQLKAA